MGPNTKPIKAHRKNQKPIKASANLPGEAETAPRPPLAVFPETPPPPRFSSPLSSGAATGGAPRVPLPSPPMSCRAAPWGRPSLPGGRPSPGSARQRGPFGEIHELSSSRLLLLCTLRCCGLRGCVVMLG